MSNTTFANVVVRASLDAIAGLFNSGGAGYIEVWEGTLPANCESPISGGTLLATHQLNPTAFQSAIDNGNGTASIQSNSINDDIDVDADGTPQFFRAFNNAGTCLDQGDVTDTGGNGDMKFDNITWQAGDTSKLTSWTITQSES